MGSVARQGHWLGRCSLLSAAMAVGVGSVLMLGCGGDNGTNPDNVGEPNTPVVPGGGGNNIIGDNNCTSGSTCKQKTIGTQTWMSENLNVETSESWCYGNSSDSCAKYGRLYTWNAAKTACPLGWHLPSREEWQTLVDYVGGSSVVGTKLKSRTGWNSYSGVPVGTDEYGFSALPGGGRDYSDGSFKAAGSSGVWWTATEYSSDYAYGRGMGYDFENVYDYNDYKELGFAVRCVRD